MRRDPPFSVMGYLRVELSEGAFRVEIGEIGERAVFSPKAFDIHPLWARGGRGSASRRVKQGRAWA